MRFKIYYSCGSTSIDRYPLIKPWSTEPSIGPVHNINKGLNYTSVQAAINDAIAGDTILVDSGTYYEQVVVNRQLILRGNDTGIGLPVVDARGSGSAITLAANGIILEGFNTTNSSYGIYITSNNCIIRNNNASDNNYYGIFIINSNNNTLNYNNVHSNMNYGIYLESSNNNTLTGNNISKNMRGIFVWGSDKKNFDNTIDSTNKVNGKPVYYIFDQKNIVLDQINAGHISLAYSSNIIIRNSNVSSGDGVNLLYSDNNTLNYNTANANWIGTLLVSSFNNTLSGNNASNNDIGLYLYYSNNNTLTGNIASDNRYGIFLSSSNNNTVVGNNASNNFYGTQISSSSNNILYQNNLVNNSNYNAYDYNGNNQWDNGTIGNWYSNYDETYEGCTDDDGSGTCDLSYNIPGGSSVDRYPFSITPVNRRGLVAEWYFDEGSGNLVNDNSGFGNDGTIYGAKWTTGLVGGALEFDGNNDYVEVPDSPELSGGAGKNMTVEFWFNSNKQNGHIITKWKDISYKDWGTSIGAVGPGLFFWYENGGRDRRFYGGTIDEGVWHHGAFTFERSTGTNNAKLTLYLDGKELDLINFDGVSPDQLYDMPDTAVPVSIGYSGKYYNNGFFDGKIDEIKIYSRVLSEEEIRAEYRKWITLPSVNNLTAKSSASWINWTWENPQDFDFNHTVVYIDGFWKVNTSKNYYNLTGLLSNTTHTISLQTVDVNGNVNQTWVNDTATTLLQNLIIIPAIVSPVEGSIVSGTLTLNATTTSTGIASASFEYSLDGLSWTVIASDTSSSDGWTALWDTTTIPDGVYTLRVVMTDTNGLVGEDSIVVTVFNHARLELTALPSLKTVDGVNASYSIAIFNGQYSEDTFDLNVLNPDGADVAALNQTVITIPAWGTGEVTLNVTDNIPGVYTVSVRVSSQSNPNVTNTVITTTDVRESFSLSLKPENGARTSIGADTTYLLSIKNNQRNPDTLTLDASGIDTAWLSFEALHPLSAGEEKTIPLEISIPESGTAGSFNLTVSVASSNTGTIRTISAPLTVQNGPVISGLVPENSHLGSDDVVFSWITNMNSTTKVILNQSGVDTVYTSDEGIYHNVIVENLTRTQWYTYRVISNTSHGSTQSDERSFYIDNGVSFTKKIYDFNIEHDYDQRVAVTVKNTDNIAHEILLTVNSTNPELIVGFVGEGSIDEMITLAPDETKDVVLALHAQDALQEDYYLLLNLTTDDNITDNAIANIHVRQPNIDLRFDELSTYPLTLTKSFRITNHGDTVTDLNIYESSGLKGYVTFDPIVTHGYLGSGSSITFEAIPLLSLDFTEMRGSIVAEAAGVNTSFPVNFTLPDGMGVYYGSVPNVTIEFSDYFDNDNSPNTNPQGVLVESYLTNGSLIFFSQIIVDVFQDGEPVSNANVTLKAWNSNGKTIILNGFSDLGGKALFAVFGKADDYSYKAIVDDYKVETEMRNFSVDTVNYLYKIYHDNITWSIISDSNSTFNNFTEAVVLDNAPYFFKATKNVIETNETFILDLRWKFDHQKQVTIPGSIDGNNIIFNTSGIPVGNYTATIVSIFNETVSLSETINLTVIDVNGMQKQKNYTFWVPFPVNKTHMATLNIEHEVLSEDSKIILDLNDVGTNNHNKSEYLFKYYILSNETKTKNFEITIVTPRGSIYSYMAPISLEAYTINKPLD
ncbi:MAG: right-handed parallel beta-helix repeat-containing protein [Proteobacteria bacterium]|nr:right-handed parallel beta-helix repeat-containing protein [Pseudomonadota bacterium]